MTNSGNIHLWFMSLVKRELSWVYMNDMHDGWVWQLGNMVRKSPDRGINFWYWNIAWYAWTWWITEWDVMADKLVSPVFLYARSWTSFMQWSGLYETNHMLISTFYCIQLSTQLAEIQIQICLQNIYELGVIHSVINSIEIDQPPE